MYRESILWLFVVGVGVSTLALESCDPEPSSDSPSYPTVQINPDDSPETLNIEVYNPRGTPGYSVQIHEIGGAFDDSVDGPVSEVCIPITTSAGPTFIQQIVLPASTVPSTIAVFAQLYVNPGDGGSPATGDATVARDGVSDASSTPDATVAADGGLTDAATPAASIATDGGQPGACPGIPFGSSAVWPGAPTLPVDAGVVDGASDAHHATDTGSDVGSDAASDALADVGRDASGDSSGADADGSASDAGGSDAGGDQ